MERRLAAILATDVVGYSRLISANGKREVRLSGLAGQIYHALALEVGVTFVTAGKKHLIKTKSFGAVQLLEEWAV